MAAEQLKALLQSHIEGNESQFYSVAMQMAAHEAKLGHGKLAKDLRDIIDKAKATSDISIKPTLLVKPRGELSGLLEVSYPKLKLADMVLSPVISMRLNRLLKEQIQIQKIRSFGLSRVPPGRVGPPGLDTP